MTKSLSELEKQLDPSKKALEIVALAWCQESTKHKTMDIALAIEFARILESQLAAVQKELQEYKEALEWMQKSHLDLTSHEGCMCVYKDFGSGHPVIKGKGKTSIEAIQSAMKLERKGE